MSNHVEVELESCSISSIIVVGTIVDCNWIRPDVELDVTCVHYKWRLLVQFFMLVRSLVLQEMLNKGALLLSVI